MSDQTPPPATPAWVTPATIKRKAIPGVRVIDWVALSFAIIGSIGFFPSVVTTALMGMGGAGSHESIRTSAIFQFVASLVVLALAIVALALTLRQRVSAVVPIIAVVLASLTALGSLIFVLPAIFQS